MHKSDEYTCNLDLQLLIGHTRKNSSVAKP